MMTRIQLGRATSIGKREAIFLTAEGIECDSSDQFQLAQRRVLFEDAELLTLHRPTDKLFIAITGSTALLFLTIGIALYLKSELIAAITPLIIGALFAAVAIFRLTLKPSVVTVFGKRSNIAIRFNVHHAQARVVYQDLQTAIHSAQRTQRLQSTSAQPLVVDAPPSGSLPRMPEWPDSTFAPIPEPPRDREP